MRFFIRLMMATSVLGLLAAGVPAMAQSAASDGTPKSASSKAHNKKHHKSHKKSSSGAASKPATVTQPGS